jgi:hypothetical protein
MSNLPRKHFAWKEPKNFRHALNLVRAPDTRWWHMPLLGLICSGAFMLVWASLRLFLDKALPPFGTVALRALLAGQLYAFTQCWLTRICAGRVQFFDDRLRLQRNDCQKTWKFREIESYALSDHGGFRILVLNPKEGRQSLVGVPMKVDPLAIESFLSRKGLVKAKSGGRHQYLSCETAWEKFESVLSKR